MSVFYIASWDVVFIHIPKTAGTSIRKQCGLEVVGPYFSKVPTEYENKFKFAFVRDPIDRFISSCNMFAHGTFDQSGEARKDARNDLSIDWAINVLMNQSNYDPPLADAGAQFLHHALPFTHPYNCLHEADFIGSFDHFDDDFYRLMTHLNLSFTLDEKLHISHKGFSRDDLNVQQLDTLLKYYAEDLAFYKRHLASRENLG